MHENEISRLVIGAAIEVHRELGPGLLEAAYEECLAHEMHLRGIVFERQKPISIRYKGVMVDAGFRLDFLVMDKVILELKAVESLIPIHQAQLMTYLKLTDLKLGLLMNFNVLKLTNGLKRVALDLEDG